MLESEITVWPRRFYLLRVIDISGVSGTGVVAFGTMYPNKKCTISWVGEHSSINEYDNIEDVIYVHSHGGATEIKWIDKENS